MNCSVTLTANEFKTLHNALCRLDRVNNDQVIEQVEVIRQALKSAYQQENDEFDRRYAHYNQVRNELGLTTTWSIYEVDNLIGRFPFEGVETVTYKNHNGDKPVVKTIFGVTWAALYVAANAAIRDSGDDSHVFIENFKQVGNTLVLTTGS